MHDDDDELAVVHAFLQRYLADRAAGAVLGIDDYRRAFPGHEARIAAEFALLQPEDTSATTDQHIGPYRLLRQLGAGGQAIVHLAEDRRLRRQVALKVLPRDLATPEQEQRLRREAQVAARRDDPGVAEVFDVGSDRSHFYVAMRYVEGATLAERIDRDRRARGAGHCVRLVDDVDDRGALRLVLDAFVALLQSLAQAHRDGVVHRDVKPGNLMITPDGRPVLLDFGLARDGNSDLPTLTRTGDVFGTPAYLAPELISGQADRADAATDVYAAAVTLYEALTLERPFAGATREALFHAVLASDVVDVRRRNPRLPRDLTVVVATGLARDRARRYPSAADFADDLERVRDGRPIAARPPSLARRLAGACRRHPAIAAGSLVVVFAAVLLFVQQEARVAAVTAARDEAEAVNSFLIGELLLSVGPQRARGADLRVGEVLDRASARVDEAFAADTASGAAVRHVLGDAYASISRFAEAQRWFDAALAMRTRLFGTQHAATLASALRVAQMHLANDRFDAASDGFAALVQQATAVFGAGDLRTLRARIGCANVDFARGRWAAALAPLADIEAAASGRDEDLRLDAAELRGRCLVRLDRRSEAEPVFRQVLADREALADGDPLQLQDIRNDLGSLQHDRALSGNDVACWDEAQRLYEHALHEAEALFGAGHEQTAIACNNLGLLLKDRAAQLGQRSLFPEAHSLLERSLALRRTLYGDDSTRVATALDSLGGLLHDQGEFVAAVPLYDECWQLRARRLGADHDLTLRSLINLGTCLLRAGDLRVADERFTELCARLAARPQFDRNERMIALFYAGRCAASLDDLPLARERLAAALDLAIATFGADSRQAKMIDKHRRALEGR